ncbi:hypothetical protein L2Y94_05670 [Luteibacter aegosomatis]|uniref:Rz1-like lysis system protein LysC n=1 Tax=Luteibacter aegosomatis TaxID=2911537 RepID=UPI001FF94AFF|nr:hypothetical protein [Luteibacter aegosomatis]UPG86842.1 hypothetical protein L2Y94_05670 [Luteibacter aegosomatis]
MSRALWLLIACLPLTGCPETKAPVPMPKVVRVEVPVYVAIPAALTQDCPIAEPTSLKVEEAVRVANARKVALQNCNADKAAIRAIGEQAGK